MFSRLNVRRSRSAIAFGALLLAGASSAQAAFVIPAFRGQADTTYQAWDVFTSLAGPNAPDVALVNPNGVPNVREFTGAGFIPASGNLYVQAEIGDFEVTVPDYNLGGGFATNVVVQFRTQGSPLDLDSILWNGVAWDDSELLLEVPLGGFGGFLQEWKFEWDNVPGSPAENVLTFLASDVSLSLDVLSVDTQTVVAVPEAGTLLFTATSAALVAAGLWRRRSRRVETE